MSEPINPTAADRAETRELCRRVIASAVEDAPMPLGLQVVPVPDAGPMVHLSDAEDLVMQLALEVQALRTERDNARATARILAHPCNPGEVMTLDVKELRRLAEAATPGPWAYRMGEVVQLTDAGKGYPLDYYPDSADVISRDLDGDRALADRDAEYIAAANPSTVLALLDQLAAVTAARDELATMLDAVDWLTFPDGYATHEAKEARIASLRKVGR